MKTFEARRNRRGQVVAVGPAREIASAVGELAELVAPDGQRAFGRIHSTGRGWTDPHSGETHAYGYLDPTSITDPVGAP